MNHTWTVTTLTDTRTYIMHFADNNFSWERSRVDAQEGVDFFSVSFSWCGRQHRFDYPGKHALIATLNKLLPSVSPLGLTLSVCLSVCLSSSYDDNTRTRSHRIVIFRVKDFMQVFKMLKINDLESHLQGQGNNLCTITSSLKENVA